MKKNLCVIVLLIGCSSHEQKNELPFTGAPIDDEEWSIFEGRWKSGESVFYLELSLKNGSPGVESEYNLRESLVSDSAASGTVSHDHYSTYTGLGHDFGIRLHNLSEYSFGSRLRYRANPEDKEEIFLMTRGDQELLPCDDQFKPLTTDWHYTLHKRSKLFTIEGYFTFEADSASFYERNTSEHWKLAELGEFDELKQLYPKLASEKYEGVYLKGLAYSIVGRNN